ncbi:sugar porter family MFS transporter [Gynurincola endophyticus]|uniref:sugar porter family MFS transporter n=1 Tax=Gynurincola endophyticus TaxID=2479004 RepID=UPI000F8C73CC|nr:sugar porter family MFS transporter [Gynurincola endophyticus]
MKKISKQEFICLTAALGGLLFGFDTAVISGALSPIKIQFSLNSGMEGWLVSSGLIGCISGVAATSMVSDKIGRKKTIILSAWMFLASAILCAGSFSVSMLVIGRMIGGIGVGMASVISPMFITEFAPAEKRGRMVSYYQLSITAGILLAYFSNALLDTRSAQSIFQTEIWRPMFLVMAIPSVIFMLLLAKVPESPRWLISINEKQKAASILFKIIPPETAAREFKAMEEAADKSRQNSRSLFSKPLRLTLFIGTILAVLQQFSGINAIIYYGPSIFEKAGIDSQNALLFQVIIGSVNLLSTFIAIKWTDKYGRRKLMIIGLIGIIVSLLGCGWLFYTDYTQGYLLLILMLFFIACFAFSLGPVTWVIINEIFPTDVRVKSVAFCTLMLWVAVWMVGQFVPWLLEQAGAAWLFWIFAAFSTINLIIIWKLVKETSGKTLEEIEEAFVSPH